MKYDLVIKEHNVKPHLDLENDIRARKEGLFTFVLRVNNGFITDYNLMENVDAKRKYPGVEEVIRGKLASSSNN